MKSPLVSVVSVAFLAASTATTARAVLLIGGGLNNGNLDRTYAQEIVPGHFLPKPLVWTNTGTRAITGAYEDELSSEPWAGPLPTPATTDGSIDPYPEAVGGPDGAVFFKPFSGNQSDGPATGHLTQIHPANPDWLYTFSGWAGAEAAALMAAAEFAIEFRDAAQALIPASGAVLNLHDNGLVTPNGQPFNYKEYTVSAVAPANAAFVQVRISMIDATGNPAGGGQAFVVDDFTLTGVIPEPSFIGLAAIAPVLCARTRRRR